MSRHTPGPWEVNHAGTGRDGKLIYDEVYVYAPSCGVNDIAIASDIADPLGKDDGMANALLIASAPDLLEALQKFVEYEKAMDERDDVSGMLLYAEFSKLAHAVIKKATGEQA